MNPYLASVIKMALLSGTALGGIAMFLFAHRKPAQSDTEALDRISTRLERIEQAVDAIAIEVERVSEGQRFTSRLLAEKSIDAGQSHPQVRQVTPH